MSGSLTAIERRALDECEAKIEKGLLAFYEAGQALRDIRDGKLYRAEYKTFEEYCQVRWKLSRPRAYELMAASTVISNLSAVADTLPENERQVRPLTQLEPEEQVEAWQAAQAIAPETPNTAHVERSVQAVKAKPTQSLEVGQTIAVSDRESPVYGKQVTIKSVSGVIVEAETENGTVLPFLTTELTGELVEKPTQKTAPKPSAIEAIAAELDLTRTRCELLEVKLEEAIALLEQYASHADLSGWVASARILLS